MSDSKEEIVWLASFDIGKKNFSFYIEELDKSDLLQLKDMTKSKRYKPSGVPSKGFELILDDVFLSGKKILLDNVDLTTGCDSSKYLDTQVFYNMIEMMDTHKDYWDQCDVFIIEKQMSFGKRHNTMALKLGQHCWSYFALRYGKSKKIVEFPAYHKTQVLGAEKKVKHTKNGKTRYKSMDKAARKKWCINKALTILDSREDIESISQIQDSYKKDDLCDVICQLQAYKYLTYVNKGK